MDEKKYSALQLENQLCFPLYACSRETIKLYTPHLDALGLTYTQYIAMMVLWKRKSVTVKALGEELFLDSGTLTPLLKKLETKGLVSRRRSTMDERNLIVTITEEGMRLREEALEIPAKMAQCVNLEPQGVHTLYTLLYKMLDRRSDTNE